MRGAAAKPTGKLSRERDAQRPTLPTTELEGGKAKAPRLPGRSKLSVATRRWWDTWSTSPQSAQFLVTDWQRLLMLVPIVEAFFAGDLSLMGEIRLNEAKLGGTPEDRLRLRWKMRDAAQAEERDEKAKKRTTSRGRKDPRLKLVESGS